MSLRVRRGLTIFSAVATLGLALSHPAFAQNPPAKPGAAAPVAAPAPVPDPNLKQVLATVNNESITRGELYKFLSQYQLPAGKDEQQQVYHDAMETLVNTHLVNQFLARQNLPVSEEKIDQSIDVLEKQVKQNGSDLATEMTRTGSSMADIRKEYANRLRWIEFLNKKATDSELMSFVAGHKDLFNGTQVKAGHILLRTDPETSAADKQKIREKLANIRKDVQAGKLTFAEAANKYSEDPGNTEGAGGDLGYFTLNSGFIEEFAAPAFAMKKGEISGPVETPYGYHLILVTDRKEGTPLNFEQNKPLAKQIYAADLQKTLLTAQRKDAKIDVKPMPSDLFPSAPPAATTPAPAATKPTVPK